MIFITTLNRKIAKLIKSGQLSEKKVFEIYRNVCR